MLKHILFTHDDLDGAGCRIVYEIAHMDSKLKKDEDYMVINCSNGGVDAEVMEVLNSGKIDKNTEIMFGDIVASRETLEYIVNNFSMPKIFDHHRTNFFATWIVPEAVIVPENELGVMQSGTSLMYQYFNSGNEPIWGTWMGNPEFMSDLVDTIRSYDTYEWKETNNILARKLMILFTLLGMDKFCETYIDRIWKDQYSGELIDRNDIKFVDAKMDNEQKIIDSITPDDVYQIEVRGLKTAFALGSFGVSVSELGNQFLEKYPEFDMFAAFTLWRGGEFSFRSIRDDLDLGKDIALVIGGGGHPKAAGAQIDESFRDELVNMLINYMNK